MTTTDHIKVFTVNNGSRTLCYERRGANILIGKLPEWVQRVGGHAKDLKGEEGYLKKQREIE